MATSLHHDMSTCDKVCYKHLIIIIAVIRLIHPVKVQAARALLYQLAGVDNIEEVPDKPTKWKNLCATILMQKVSVSHS